MNFLISSQQGLDQLKQKSMTYRCSTETQLLDTAPQNVEQKWVIGVLWSSTTSLVCILSMLFLKLRLWLGSMQPRLCCYPLEQVDKDQNGGHDSHFVLRSRWGHTHVTWRISHETSSTMRPSTVHWTLSLLWDSDMAIVLPLNPSFTQKRRCILCIFPFVNFGLMMTSFWAVLDG